MSKIIAFCADGTWNGPGQPDDDDKTAPATNVFKLFLNLQGRDTPGTTQLEKEQERALTGDDGTEQQVAKYLHGVGDSDNFLVKALGGTIGSGLITRIVRGYTFISRNYAPGDKVFIVGFSRGAYTARALAGLIAAKGLLDAAKIDLADKTNAYRLGAAVWYAYLAAALQANTDWLGRLQEMALDLPHFVSKPPGDDQLIKAPIEAVAVWETVGSLGIPEFNVAMTRVDAFQFADTRLSPVVRHAFHAVAVDEQRRDFTPTLWDADSRIVQVLFPGAHADVGGGYPSTNDESGVSDCTLQWMMQQLQPLGVLFSIPPSHAMKPDPTGTSHQPWMHVPWNILLRGVRSFPTGLCVSLCLTERLGIPVIGEPGTPPSPYSPNNLAGYVSGTSIVQGVTVV